jgi:hypothetical protein
MVITEIKGNLKKKSQERFNLAASELVVGVHITTSGSNFTVSTQFIVADLAI